MSQLARKDGAATIVPAVHLEFIQNQAGLPVETGLGEVEAYHRALFLHHHARDLEQFAQRTRIHEERLSHLELRLADTRGKLAVLEPLVPVSVDGEPDLKPTLPWNSWDRGMFAVSALGIACLLVFGVLNISFNLLESGLVTFVENPVRAYFWAALLPVGALAVKVGWDSLQSRKLREIYFWSCLAAGIVGVLVWLAAYAVIYPTLSKSTREQVESLSVYEDRSGHPGGLQGTTSSGVKWVDALTVVAQAAAEVFLSAVLGMHLTTLYLRHRPVRLAGNPLFGQLDEERRFLEQGVEQERLALADARGGQRRLEHELTALLSFARALFHKETGVHQDQSHRKRLILDQISDQLRSQLESVENGRVNERNHHATDVAPVRKEER